MSGRALAAWAVCGLAVAAAAWGHHAQAQLWRTQAAALQGGLQQAQQRAQDAERVVQRLQHAQTVADGLTQQLARTEALLAATLKERNDALARATTGRPCLREPALRLLDGAPGLRVLGLPGAAGGLAAAHAAGSTAAAQQPDGAFGASQPAPDEPRPDEPASTDTQVAAWVLAAGAQYQTCQARLDALIDWHHAQRDAP